jgi:hypothetical protein
MQRFIFHKLDDIPLFPLGDGGILGQFFVENPIPYRRKFKIVDLDQQDNHSSISCSPTKPLEAPLAVIFQSFS